MSAPSEARAPLTVDVWITRLGSLIYTCPRCGGVHFHGGADHHIGDVTHRVAHCRTGDVELRIVADDREALGDAA